MKRVCAFTQKLLLIVSELGKMVESVRDMAWRLRGIFRRSASKTLGQAVRTIKLANFGESFEQILLHVMKCFAGTSVWRTAKYLKIPCARSQCHFAPMI